MTTPPVGIGLRYAIGAFALAGGVAIAVRGWRGRKLLGLIPPVLWLLGEYAVTYVVVDLWHEQHTGRSATLAAGLEIASLVLAGILGVAVERHRSRVLMQGLDRRFDEERRKLDEARKGPFR